MNDDQRDSLWLPNTPRSRKLFRWMPGPVLSHNLPVSAPPPATALSRNLYKRKLGGGEAAPLRLEASLSYLVIVRGRGWLLTWHAPWCRRCDCAGAGWAFARDRGYWSGLGFELSYPAGDL